MISKPFGENMKVDYNLDNINVYHNLVPFALAQEIIDFLYDTTWKIGWSDKGWYDADADAKYYFHDFIQTINDEMVIDDILPPFLDCVKNSPAWLENGLDKCSISRAVANCVSIADITYRHSHNSKKAMVYHANLEWRPEWGGELFYYDASGSTIEKVVQYTPGQVVIHDGQLVHHLKPPYKNGPKFRFSFGIFWDEIKNEETMGNN
tara:strand:- start:228 stop:848 length:621 start_codon:yes stop_codon:yes gene_type:complete